MVRITTQVPTILSDWASSIRANNSSEMVNFYCQNAVLVGTYSQPLEVGLKQIREYFDMFLDRKSISCEILDNVNQELDCCMISVLPLFPWFLTKIRLTKGENRLEKLLIKEKKLWSADRQSWQ